jgi:hypothetical protein
MRWIAQVLVMLLLQLWYLWLEYQSITATASTTAAIKADLYNIAVRVVSRLTFLTLYRVLRTAAMRYCCRRAWML